MRTLTAIAWACGAMVAMMLASAAWVEADYPFRDAKLSDEARIDDLLKRLTVDEKIELMPAPRRFRGSVIRVLTASPTGYRGIQRAQSHEASGSFGDAEGECEQSGG